YCPRFGDGIGLCGAIAQATREIAFGTAIANIYTRHPFDYAQTVTMIQELSGGRFRFGIGVSHEPVNVRLGLKSSKPLADTRQFVEQLQKGASRWGDLPPVVLATLRRKMAELAAEVGQGAVWANAARSHMKDSVAFLGAKARDDAFFVGNMIPTCIDDDRDAAAVVMKK